MLLSKLAYLCVKRCAGSNASDLGYADFCSGARQGDLYLDDSIGRVFSDINSFMGRLVQLEKIPAVIDQVVLDEEEKLFIDFSSLSFYPNLIKSVFQLSTEGKPFFIEWAVFGKKIMLKSRYDRSKPLYVQYRLSMPSFSLDDIVPLEDDGKDNNIDLLAEYGIMEEAMPLCIDYVDALQNRDTDPAISNSLEVKVESKIAGLNTNESLILPNKIKAVHRI